MVQVPSLSTLEMIRKWQMLASQMVQGGRIWLKIDGIGIRLEKLGIRLEKQKVAARSHECTQLCCHHMAVIAIKITIKVVVFENVDKEKKMEPLTEMLLGSVFDNDWLPETHQGCV